MNDNKSIIFGPVPSRRLGHSLGINNIPPKICTYSCAYCQLGRTIKMQIDRQEFYKTDFIVEAVKDKINLSKKTAETIDYLTFVPDGEPTLDINLGKEISILKTLKIPVAVITNCSLIWQPQVREDLSRADWVSLKVDAVDHSIWRKIDHPHRELSLESILEGALKFSHIYKGILVTETMLAANINDFSQHLIKLADFIFKLKPAVSYISVPVRPPADKKIKQPDENSLNRAYHIFKDKIKNVELLTGYEGDAFASTGNSIEDILSITAVHPMRKDAVDVLLEKNGDNWPVVEKMLENNLLAELIYEGHKFYLRKFKK
jgi:wyosine [tRNA(Phe)-imidazoG37] synthetase (radical SAM superfamily)